MEEIVALILKTYGVAGLIMLSPLAAVVFLWRHTIGLNKEITRINELRIADAKAVSDKLLETVKEQSSLNKETNMALDRVGDLMSVISSQSR